ncbi:MAG: HAD-IB family hydrolase [Bacteroidales bacterium]|nr:HAD-IB family hydrolase [Bacteroidales bacterium]
MIKANQKKGKLALFDFDGTITSKDTFMDFIHFSVEPKKFRKGMFAMIPVYMKYLFGRISNRTLKEECLSYFFGGWNILNFREKAEDYGINNIPPLIIREADEKIRWHQERKHNVFIVTASLSDWMIDWCESREIGLIANELEIKNGVISGKLKGVNCHGEGKIERITKQVNLLDFDYIYAYGNSKADKAMLNLAHESFFKPFS